LDVTGNLSYARSLRDGENGAAAGRVFLFGAIATNQTGVNNISEAFQETTHPNAPILGVRNPPAIFAAGNGLVFAAWSEDQGQTGPNSIPMMRIRVACCSDNGDQWLNYQSPDPGAYGSMGGSAPQYTLLLPLGNLSDTAQDRYFMPRLSGMPDGTIGCAFLYLQLTNNGQVIPAQLSTCLAAWLPTQIAGQEYIDPNTTIVVIVSDQATNPLATNPVFRFGHSPNGYFIGDFIGLAATASGFFPYWSDTRNGTAQIMTSHLAVLPAFAWNGAPLSPPSGVQFIAGTLAVATNADGRIEIFAVNEADGNVWHAYQQTAGGGRDWAVNGQTWHPLSPVPAGVSFVPHPSLYGPMQSPAVVMRAEALEVFAISSDGQPYRISQGGVGAVGGWGPWTPLVPPPGNIWSISAKANGEMALVVYSTDQGVFWDLGGPGFGQLSIPEVWLGPRGRPEPANNLVNIVRAAYAYGSSMIGMSIAIPGTFSEIFYYSQFNDGNWTDWQPGPSGIPAATLRDYRIGYLVGNGFEIFGVESLDGNLIVAINGLNGITSWTNFITLTDGPFQYGVLDVGALPEVGGPQRGEYEGFIFQYNCVFVTDEVGAVLQVVPVLGSNGNLLYQPFGPFALDNNSDGHFGTISTLAVGVNQDTRLEVVALESTNQCFHWWQSSPDPQLQEFGLPEI